MYRTSSRYGWKADLPDQRDLHYSAKDETLKALPAKVDLRPLMPPVYSQGQIGSCTANAIAAAFEYDLTRQKAATIFTPSRLFIYYNERAIEGTVTADNGGQIRDGVKSIGSLGVCPETLWPYVPTSFAQKPSAACYADALKNKAIHYKRVGQEASQLKACLAEGFAIIMGFTVYTAFESAEVARTGILNMPEPTETTVGGHAVLVVGYDDTEKRVIVRNSWGNTWGQLGYFTMPYEYLTNKGLARDFWAIEVVK